MLNSKNEIIEYLNKKINMLESEIKKVSLSNEKIKLNIQIKKILIEQCNNLLSNQDK